MATPHSDGSYSDDDEDSELSSMCSTLRTSSTVSLVPSTLQSGASKDPVKRERPGTHCYLCGSKFGELVNRKHHCRMCGANVCHACSPNLIEVSGELQRFCGPCVMGGAGALDLLPRLQHVLEMLHMFTSVLPGELPGEQGPTISYALPLQAVEEVEEAVVNLVLRQYQSLNHASMAQPVMDSTGGPPGDYLSTTGPPVVPVVGSLGSRGRAMNSILSMGGCNSLGSWGYKAGNLSFPQGVGLLPIKPCKPEVQPFAEWEVNTAHCGICNAALGKRNLRRRHHCRVCGRCICSTCSPNFVELPSMRGSQRVCILCIAIVHTPVKPSQTPRAIKWIVSRGTMSHRV